MYALPLPLRFFLVRCLPLLALAFLATAAIAQADPPARVAALTHTEGSVAFAPVGEAEWADAIMNRPITRGDRLWTDPGGRAELHLGAAGLHLASQTFIEVVALDHEVLQLNLNEGIVNARVRQLEGGENFEITTPQLAFRAAQPGDYRIDVDPERGHTRVTVGSGVAMVYGAGAGVVQLQAGQRMAFTGRDLAAVAVSGPVEDAFDRWAADRNRSEDQSIAARYVPREVVGYQELDAHGVWSHDPSYGAVWYPNITVADWAPYRYGRWDWIAPWGWTWIDDARWGFAPFHYGRWAHIGSRWAWVPGRIGRRPVYSPALVAFVGGGGANWNLSDRSGPGIGWFPLAPGEAWRPTYRTSTVYLRNANRNAIYNHAERGFLFQRRPEAITAVRIDDFNRGRPVHQHWNRLGPADLARAQVSVQPVLPEPRRRTETARVTPHAPQQPQPRVQAPPSPTIAGPRPQFMPPGIARQHERAYEDPRGRVFQQPLMPQVDRSHQIQQMQQQQQQREQALRDQQAIQHQQAIQQQERVQRQQQAAQERFQRQHEWQRQRAMPMQRQLPPQAVAPAVAQPPAPPARMEGRERGQERGWRGHQQREERAAQGEDEGRGRGRGRFN